MIYYCYAIVLIGPDHVQMTKVNWKGKLIMAFLQIFAIILIMLFQSGASRRLFFHLMSELIIFSNMAEKMKKPIVQTLALSPLLLVHGSAILTHE